MNISINRDVVVKRLLPPDDEGFYYLTMGDKTIKLKPEFIKINEKREMCEVRYRVLKENGKYGMARMTISTYDALKLKDFILQRKLYTLQSWDELNDAGREAPELWGDSFRKDGLLCAYKYAESYISPEQREQMAKEKQYKKEAEKAHQAADLLGLPELKGTEKQVRWAEQIRAKYFEKTQESEINPRAKSVKTAKWWIDNHKNILR